MASKVIKLDITFESLADDGAVTTYTKHFDLIPEQFPLALIESMDSSDFGMMRRGFRRLLKLSVDESEQLTVEHLKAFADATKAAQDDPNGRGGG